MDLFGEDTSKDTLIDNTDEEQGVDALNISTEEFSHPRSMRAFMGHAAQEKEIIDLYNSGRMPHGIIFSGAKGIGKATLAYRFARFLFKQGIKDPNQNSMFDEAPSEVISLDIPASDPIFSRVASGGYPDLLSIERLYDATKNKTQDILAVSELRKVEPFLRRTASYGGWRIVLIDDADTMNRSAQNALLKILEEPPKNTMIILIAHRLGALIPTIRSRSRVIPFQPLSFDTMDDLLTRKGYAIDVDEMEILTAMAEGSFGKACEIMEEDGLENFRIIMTLLKPNNAIDWTTIHKISEQYARAGQEQAYRNFTQTLLWVYKTLAFAKARGEQLTPEALDSGVLPQILVNSSLAQLLKICENLSDHFDMTANANLDKKQGILGAFQIITA